MVLTKDAAGQKPLQPKPAGGNKPSPQLRKAVQGKEGFAAQSAALMPPAAGGAAVQFEKDKDTPSGMAFLLGDAGKDPYDVCHRAALDFGEAARNRLEKMQLAIANFETNILLHADAPQGSALSTALAALAKHVFDKTLGENPLVATVMAVGEALVERAEKAKDAEGKEALRQFVLNFRTGTIQSRMNDLTSMSGTLTDNFEAKFQKLGEKSWKAYKRDDAFVEGPQGQYLRTLLTQSADAKASAQAATIESMEQSLLESWVSGQSKRYEGNGYDGFREVLQDGYIRIVYESAFDWSQDSQQPTGVKSTSLMGAALWCDSASETVQRLKETMSPFDVWEIKCPKRVLVFEQGTMGPAVIDAEVGANHGLESLHDEYGMYRSQGREWYGRPIPKDKFAAK